MSGKVSIKDLAEILMNRFEFGESEAILLARYMIEQDSESDKINLDLDRNVS
jgi:hypothetical protein